MTKAEKRHLDRVAALPCCLCGESPVHVHHVREGKGQMNWRNRKFLAMAKNVPVCMGCGKSNCGDVVAAHSNQQRDGKGTGIKAHDYRIAFLCGACHYEIDDGSLMTRAERVDFWEVAHRKSIGWLIESGRLTVNG